MLKLEDSLEKSTDCETGSPDFFEKDRRSLKMQKARLTMQANFFTQSRSNSQNSLNGSPKHCFSEKDSNGTPKNNAIQRGARTSKNSRYSEDFTHATQNYEFQPEGRRGYNPSRFGNTVAQVATTHDDSAPEEQLSTSINCLDHLTQPEVRKVSSCLPDSHFLYRDDNDNNNDNFDDQMDFPAISRTETWKSRWEGERLDELCDEDEGEDPSDLLDRQNTGLSSEFVFLRNQDDDVENLKEELQITEQDYDIHFIEGTFSDYFTEGKVLGQGASGVVKKCTRIQDGEVYAVKNIRYRGDTERLLLIVKEFKNHRKLDHKNIIKVHELYIDYINKRIYTIMELVECKELLEVIKDLGNYSEAIASSIFKQIIVGINYLHIKGVCHRDIKPDNILVSRDGKIVKIADFNVSKFHDSDESKKYTALSKKNYKMWTHTGTLAFSAPEVFTDSEYTEAVDMWSSGVVLYTMLCGYQPFNSEENQDLTEMIQKGKYEFHADPWDKISSDAKDLIKRLLVVNPNTRYSPFEALTHPWIVTTKKLPNIRIARVIENIWKYLNRNSKKVAAAAKKNTSPKSAMKPCQDEVRLNIDFTETPKALLSQAKALVKNPRTAYKITSNISEPCNAKEFIELQKDLENSKTIFKAFLFNDENQKEKNKEAYLVNLFNQAIDKSHNTINLDENCRKNLLAQTPNDGIFYNRFDFDLAALGMADNSPAANLLAQTPKDENLHNGYDFGLKLMALEDSLPAVFLRKGGSAEPFNIRRNEFLDIQHEVKQLDCLIEDEDS